MRKVYVFPGQGSQKLGMGKEFYDAYAEARHVFEEVDDALNQKLSKIIFDGNESDLNMTVNTQPALMATSMAMVAVIEKQAGIKISDGYCVAGHSLGEYTALTAAGVLGLSDTARLLRIRGQAMQDAVPQAIGAMAAILGLEMDQVDLIVKQAAQGQVCEIANDNSPGQVVISGHMQAVERAIALAAKAGAKRSVLLPVSAPFHCQLMEPAANIMAEALSKVVFHSPTTPVLTNVTACLESNVEHIRNNLVKQVTGRVRWRESIATLSEHGVNMILEVGAGKVLSGLCRRIVPDITVCAINAPQDIEEALVA